MGATENVTSGAVDTNMLYKHVHTNLILDTFLKNAICNSEVCGCHLYLQRHFFKNVSVNINCDICKISIMISVKVHLPPCGKCIMLSQY